MTKYFYKLGHCQDLAIEEYYQFSGETDFKIDSGWLLGNTHLNVNLTGSLVFNGQVLAMHDKFDEDGLVESLEQVLRDFQENTESSGKKIGLVLPKKYQNLGLNFAKKAGFKKVNVTSKLPNFGSWKSTKNWILLFEFDNKFYFGKILSFSNQEFWSTLDLGLPQGDIEQGIMNLKLGRSLLNLTKKRHIWDPFCGQGRLVAAGFDQKDAYVATDLLETAPEQVKLNYEKAQKIWNWGHKFLQTPVFVSPILQTAQLDARNLSEVDYDMLGKVPQLAIVTEGHLGKNFQSTPSVAEIQAELTKVFDMWKDVLRSADKLKIPEVVFCLPLYLRSKENGDKWIWPKFEDKLIVGTNYKLQKFVNGKTNILYAREQGFVGHLILKVAL